LPELLDAAGSNIPLDLPPYATLSLNVVRVLKAISQPDFKSEATQLKKSKFSRKEKKITFQFENK